MKSGFLIDYLTFTTNQFSLEEIKKLMQLDEMPWEESTSKWFYKNGEFFMNIKILYNPKEEKDEGNITVEMTGKGCRAYETFGDGEFYKFFELSKEGKIHITRIDLAFDDKDGLLSIDKLARLTNSVDQDGNPIYFSSEYTKTSVTKSHPLGGITIYWGSKTSETFYRVYDKAKEQGDTQSHWIRYELQLRKPTAERFIHTAMDKYGERWDIFWREFLIKKIRFVSRPRDCHDQRIRRLPTAPFWKKFLQNVEKAKLLPKQGIDYELDNLERFVFHQAGQAIQTMINIDGIENFLRLLKEEEKKKKKPNPKYAHLEEKIKRTRAYNRRKNWLAHLNRPKEELEKISLRADQNECEKS